MRALGFHAREIAGNIDLFGYRADLTRDPLPMYTYRVLSRIPDFVPLGGMMLGGIWWITHRREEVAAAEGPQATKTDVKKESEQ